MEPRVVCRTCLVDDYDLVEVFSDSGVDLSLISKLKEHLSIHIVDTDVYVALCRKCIDLLNDFDQIFKLAQTTQDYFPSILQGKSQVPMNELIEIVVKTEPFQVEVESDNCPDYEAEEDMSYQMTQEILETEEEVVGKKQEKSGRKRNNSPGSQEARKAEVMERRARENELISSGITMSCSECNTPFSTFEDLSAHCRGEHKMDKGLVTCCGRKFNTRLKLYDHIMVHLDPKAFTCQICHKKFAGARFLRTHMESHMPDDERQYSCEKCPKKFPSKNRLALHLQSHNEEYSYKCHICTKSFNQNATLYSHLRYVHSSQTFVCEVCAKVFKTKEAFVAHQANHSNNPAPRLTCEICGSKLKNKDSLQAHMQRHRAPAQLLHCKICNRAFNCKKRLTTHVKHVHSAPQFQCPECFREFKRSIFLKEHMALHTGEYLYKCKFCTREFKSNANRYSHQKKQHPLEWEEEMRKKKEG